MHRDPEVLIMSISKDVEALAKLCTSNQELFRENQSNLNRLLADMQEHKAIDNRFYSEFSAMQLQIYGSGAEPGMKTRLHETEGRVGNMWKVVWAAIATFATSAVVYFFTSLK